MGSDRSGDGEERRWSVDERAAEGVDGMRQRLDAWTARQSPLPKFREQVRALAHTQWGEPVVVLYLGHRVRPGYEIPGRREDGTVEGERQAGRFAWNVLRGAVNGVANIFTLLTAGGTHDVFQHEGRLTGPANSQALGLVDAVRSATNAWLVYSRNPARDAGPRYSPTHIGVITSAWSNPGDSPPPTMLWQAREPHTPRISPRRHRLTWPDDSVFTYRPDPEDTAESPTNDD
ncbi:MAG TPA: hypothetical protein VGP26_20085 [Actinophytocola sp.]|jgi:hypothetical protein|nr:hypothetical protein [Actinophytocola sp.]